MKFIVTQEHINKGIRINPFRCAIALCLREVFPDASVVSDSISLHIYTQFLPANLRYWIPPQEITNFVMALDRGDKVKPFEFEINDGLVLS